MTRAQEKACLGNIQSYLDRIEWLESGHNPFFGPVKECRLCLVFTYSGKYGKFRNCKICPLGPREGNCTRQNNYIDELDWEDATIPQLKTRMRWLLKKYKAAGLDIEIVEVNK